MPVLLDCVERAEHLHCVSHEHLSCWASVLSWQTYHTIPSAVSSAACVRVWPVAGISSYLLMSTGFLSLGVSEIM